jgi:hypothetical protein
MIGTKYIGMDVHRESISIAVRNAAGKVVMECIVETKANWQFWHGRSGRLMPSTWRVLGPPESI